MIGKYLHHLEVKRKLVKHNLKDRVPKENIDRLDYIKIKHFLYQKYHSKIKRQIPLKDMIHL